MTNLHLVQKSIIGMSLILFLGGAFTNSSYYWAQKRSQIASVNGEPISKTIFVRSFQNAQRSYAQQGIDLEDEKNALLKPMIKQVTFENLVQELLINQYASKEKIEVATEAIEKDVQKFILLQHKGNIERFKKRLVGNGLTPGGFRKQVKNHLLKEKVKDVITKKVALSEKQAKDYYQAHLSEYKVAEKIRVQHLLIKTSKTVTDAQAKSKAQEAIDKFKSGESFISLVKTYSEDELSKSSEGRLEPFAKDEMEAPFEKAAWALKPGALSQAPVKSDYGYHVILRGKTIPAHTLSLKEVQPRFEDRLLLQEKNKFFQNWLKKERDKADVQVTPEFQPSPETSIKPETLKSSDAKVSPKASSSLKTLESLDAKEAPKTSVSSEIKTPDTFPSTSKSE